MRVLCRNVVLSAAAIALMAVGTTAHAVTASKCSAGKIKCASGLDGGEGKCDQNPDKKGLAVDQACVNTALLALPQGDVRWSPRGEVWAAG